MKLIVQKQKAKKCQSCGVKPKLGKPTKLNGEAIASITSEGHFLLECQESYIAFTDEGVKALYDIIEKWYEVVEDLD